MPKDIFDETIEKSNSSVLDTSEKSTFDKELDVQEKKKFKKWVLSKTKKHILSNLVSTRKDYIQKCIYWLSISLVFMISITLLFVGIIVVFSRFRESIPTYFIPWIYTGAYIASMVFVTLSFFFWHKHKNKLLVKKKKRDLHNNSDLSS